MRDGSDLCNMISAFIVKHGPYEPPVLDVGGYDGPYSDLFPRPYYILDSSYDGERMPGIVNVQGWVTHGVLEGLSRGRTFNTVVSTEALEHFDDPIRAFQNMSARLNVDGKLVITSPSAWGYHPSPKDYWRLQKDAWEYLCETSGIALIELFQKQIGEAAIVGFMAGRKTCQTNVLALPPENGSTLMASLTKRCTATWEVCRRIIGSTW